MRNLLTLFYFLSATILPAQNLLEINGVVLNKVTGDAIPYASVHVRNTGVGTQANPEGKFQLRFTNTFKDSVLVVSCIGYNTRERLIRAIKIEKDVTVSLEESVQLLKTVEVTPLNPSGIVRNAIENIFTNFRAEPHRLDAFYRTSIQDNNSFTRLLEAAVYITDAKGTVFGDRSVDIRQIRKSNDLRLDKWKTSDGYLYHLVRNHPLQAQAWDFLKKGKLDDFDIELEDTRYKDKDVFYVIKMKARKTSPRNQYDVQLIINESNFAIVDITIYWKPELSNYYTWAWEQRDSSKFVADWQQSHYTYQEFDGKYYLKSSQWHRKGKVVSKTNGSTLFTTESMDELLITNIEPGKFSSVAHNFGTTDVYVIAGQMPYDEKFWQTYNRPVDSEHFRKAKKQMERNESLESQYKKYTGTEVLSEPLEKNNRRRQK